jgi:hypothetical protein
MHRGPAGAGNLNLLLQEALTPFREGQPERRYGGRVFRVGDKVTQLRSNYDKGAAGVFNGTVGVVTGMSLEDHKLTVRTDEDESVDYGFDELDELTHAYAATIHRSQGSEYPAVVIPLTMGSWLMLRRNLIYTGVTRAKKLVVLVGARRALAVAVRTTGAGRRHGPRPPARAGDSQRSLIVILATDSNAAPDDAVDPVDRRLTENRVRDEDSQSDLAAGSRHYGGRVRLGHCRGLRPAGWSGYAEPPRQSLRRGGDAVRDARSDPSGHGGSDELRHDYSGRHDSSRSRISDEEAGQGRIWMSPEELLEERSMLVLRRGQPRVRPERGLDLAGSRRDEE